jgi:hypothetical protein
MYLFAQAEKAFNAKATKATEHSFSLIFLDMLAAFSTTTSTATTSSTNDEKQGRALPFYKKSSWS